MATPSKIGVMISSRCLDLIPLAGKPVHLSELRIKLKQALESEQLLNCPLFEVWINEDAPPAAGSQDSWEHCIQQVHTADFVLVLFNGNSGGAREGGELGICHGELEAAIAQAPSKVYLIQLPLAPLRRGQDGARDAAQRVVAGRRQPSVNQPNARKFGDLVRG